MTNDDKVREGFEKLLDNDGSIDCLLVFKDGKYTNLFIQDKFNFYMYGRQSMKSDIPVEDITHRLKKAIKKLTTHQVEALIEVIDAIVTETKKESRAQALAECRQEIDNLKSQKQVDADICLSIADKYASSMEEAVDDDRTMFADLSNGASECYEAIRAQALTECRQEIDNLKSEIACYEKYGLPHNPNGN